MASTVPPRINNDPLPQTPASEWANETAAKLENTTAASPEQPIISSLVSTPGIEVPGSYPRNLDNGTSINENAAGVLDMAKQYIPTQETLMNATATAKQYLPKAVASYLPGANASAPTTSLPSQEGPQEPFQHSDGAGALPETHHQEAVAQLPDESNADKALSTSTGGVGDLPGHPLEQSVAKLPDERNGEKSELKMASSGGVGDLPGTRSEVDVAKLPEERVLEKQAESTSSDATTDPVATPTAPVLPPTEAVNKPLPPVQSQSVSNASTRAQLGDTPGERQKELEVPITSGADAVLKPHTHPLGADGTKWKGVPLDEEFQAQLDEHPDEQLNITAIAQSEHKKFTPAKNKNESGGASNVAIDGHERPSTSSTTSKFTESSDVLSTGSSGSGTSGGTPKKKTKFMDKIKGEVKVISGKIGGKEEKVEEGKRLMGKV